MSLPEHVVAEGKDGKLQVVTILLIFLVVVLMQLFLLSLLVVFIRKIKALIESQTKPYFYVILIYIIAKLAVCVTLQIRIISGIPNNWEDLTGAFIEICFKDSLMIGDCCLVELFIISFQLYNSICFGALQLKKIGQRFRIALRVTELFVLAFYVVLILLFNFDIIKYDINNAVGAAFNSLSIVAFLGSFFYLNFKMSGIMIEASLNESMKRIYKVIIVLLISRAIMGAFEILIALQINDGSFDGFIETLIANQGEYVIFAILFIGFILFTLLTQGIPMMVSLRQSVVLAFNARYDRQPIDRESMLSSNSSVLKQALIDSSSDMEDLLNDVDSQIELSTFKIVQEIRRDSALRSMKAIIGERIYILTEVNHDVSNYIIQDIENEIKEIEECNVKALNKMGFFCENNGLYIFERYRPQTLDNMIEKNPGVQDQLRLALKVAMGIQEMHRREIAHGCLNHKTVAFDLSDNVYFLDFGLESLKKYLSLTTDYTNKTFYTAVELLNDRNRVVLRPKKTADIYSFGVLLYEIVTKNTNFRDEELKEIKKKFGQESFRPKIPDNIDGNIANLMRKCWQEDPLERPSIKYVIDVLKRLTR